MQLAIAFALAALLLAGLGVYAVVAYAVAQRRGEIGVRMALGAGTGTLVRSVLGRGLRPVLWGLVAGILAALACGRLVQSLLYGVRATDPATLLAVGATLATAALVACLSPALAAARTDPAEVLRQG